MKFALNVVTLYVVASMVPRTAHINSFSDARRKVVLNLSADDQILAKHLDVGIKLDPRRLSVAARRVLADLNVLKPAQTAAAQPAPEPGEERTPDQELKPEEKSHGPQQGVLVVRALHIFIEVASRYDRHGMALGFALNAIASAFKCRTLMYVLVQLYAIRRTRELQNDAITSQPSEIWNTLVHILDKVAVLKESIDDEFDLFQRWEVIVPHFKTKDLPSDFDVFQEQVERTLDASCELSTFEQIKKHIQFDNAVIWETAIDTMKIFMKCQDVLNEMFNEIPISTMNIKVWEHFLNKPEFK